MTWIFTQIFALKLVGIRHERIQSSKKPDLRYELLENFKENPPRWKSNLSSEKKDWISWANGKPYGSCVSNRQKPGPALVSTEWVEQETLKHLNDTNSYA